MNPKNRLREYVRSIPGWFTLPEAWLIYRKARCVPNGQCIVELGSFLGRSTACLIQGSMDGNGVPVYAVDPHTGSAEHTEAWGPVDTYAAFEGNLKQYGLWENVTAIRATSLEAAMDSYPPIGLLFIDARHELQFVTEDYRSWLPGMAKGGVVAFHDTVHHDCPGPALLTAHLLARSNVRTAGFAQTTTCLKVKIGYVGISDRMENLLFLAYRSAISVPHWLRGLAFRIFRLKKRVDFN